MQTKRRRRRFGSGSIYQRGDRWMAAVVVGRTATGKVWRIRRACETFEAAEQMVRKLRLQRERGEFDPAGATVAGFLHSWLQLVNSKRSVSTYFGYANAVHKHIVRKIGTLPLSSLTAATIEAMLLDLEDEGIGARMVQAIYVALSAALGRGMRLGMIAENPCRRVERPKHRAKDIDPFTHAEVVRILDATREDRLAAVYELGFRVGMRQGEMFGLRWIDLDLDAAVLRVEQQAVEVDGRIWIGPPKTESSRRKIELPETCVKSLREHRRRQIEDGHGDSELVFCSPKGCVVRRSLFRSRAWNPLMRRLQLGNRTGHAMRHTFATHSLAAGVPVHVVSRVLGHSSARTTWDVYAHVLNADLKEAAKRFDSLYARDAELPELAWSFVA